VQIGILIKIVKINEDKVDKQMDNAPIFFGNGMFVPVNFLEELGYNVEWKEGANTVNIKTNLKPVDPRKDLPYIPDDHLFDDSWIPYGW